MCVKSVQVHEIFILNKRDLNISAFDAFGKIKRPTSEFDINRFTGINTELIQMHVNTITIFYLSCRTYQVF